MADEAAAMTSQRPYLLRALYEWIADNGMTPHVLVDAGLPGVRVPRHAVKDGRIVLNIADRAVAKLELGNEALRFTARFGGVSQAINVPLDAVIAIYARETGQGMALPEESRGGAGGTAGGDLSGEEDDANLAALLDGPDPSGEDDGGGPPDRPSGPPKRGGHLRIVK